MSSSMIALLILAWYTLSASIIFMTKRLLNSNKFPWILTFSSNVIVTLIAFCVTRFPAYRPEPLSKRMLTRLVLPIGACVAFEIGCSNMALGILEVSFATVLKGSAPLFVMFWAIILGLEIFTWRLLSSILMICTGIALATLGEPGFKTLGLILMLVSVAFSGLRWALTHSMLQGGEEARMSPLNAMLYTAPATCLFLFPIAAVLEGRTFVTFVFEESMLGRLRIGLVFGMIGAMVFVLLLLEYVLVRATSSLTVSVAAIFKELVTVIGGVIIFNEHLSVLNIAGFVLCQVGILDYTYMRYTRPEQTHTQVPSHEEIIIMSSEAELLETSQKQQGSV
eukprot:Plantae.Rhodophyta-Purpureofilum_apyrenoidigerum.ctg19525.p1 GENE.Plantae.Rhodophyta-Purpureofilum_apyrenoidigerum.ctg19525~~Plantae.Rhodophyta-Purpureofilum_apyrenoidigerum.ctg19525.p1  ORF type:complete len:366 (+),score=48.56 Plantae.Rhodophyta-Purpureofilum_apyrenoidigerum.ctg19525:90-1100(+)